MNNQLKLTDLTSQCVMCGLCSPHCPTYRITQDENESPRGRIALIRAIATQQLECDKKIIQHLDNCLQCLSCENVCPSQVAYADIMHEGQKLIFNSNKRKASIKRHFVEKLLTNPNLKRWYLKLFTFFGKTKLLKSIINSGKKLSVRESFYLPDIPMENTDELKSLEKRQTTYFKGPTQNVNIFTGCGNRLFDPTLLRDLIPLLNIMGIVIREINSDGCCGALFLRKGDENGFDRLREANIQHYQNSNLPLLSLTSTCTAQLQNDVNSIHDICSYLARIQWSRFEQLKFRPLHQKIIIHSACSLRNQLKEANFPVQLISQIPNIELIDILKKGCCGAAGNYMLEQPDMADQIAQAYIEAIINSGAKIFVTTNIGCGLHIRAQLEKMDYTLEVKHPISLLSEQLIIQPD